MAKTLTILSFILILVMVPFAVAQQDSPGQVGFALQDLSVRVGTEVTVEALDNWSWAENVYGDTSLGCPQPNQVYAQTTTRGYQFMIEYDNVFYDYRVSEDGAIVVLCSQTDMTQGTPVATPQLPLPTATPVTAPNGSVDSCPDALPIRHMIGDTARTTSLLNSNVRAEADVDSQDIGDVPPGGIFTIIGGPTCSNEGIVWWQIETTDGLQGWIAQGQSGIYYIEPIPQRLPINLMPMTPDNVEDIAQVGIIEGNFGADAAFSPDGNTLAVVDNNVVNAGIWIYDLTALESKSPTRIDTENFVTALAFSMDGALLITGDEIGNVEFWDAADGTLILSSNVYDTPVRDIDFSADGNLFTTLSDDNTLLFWGIPQGNASGG